MLSTLRNKAGSIINTHLRSKGFRYLSATPVETSDWFTWPRETEGNTYAVNWSLVGEGVTPTGNAYRNARLPLLTNMLSAKPRGNYLLEVSFVHLLVFYNRDEMYIIKIFICWFRITLRLQEAR